MAGRLYFRCSAVLENLSAKATKQVFAKGRALPGHPPAKGRKIHVKKKSKKGKKRCKNPLTRGNIFGKIIKLSERRRQQKTTKNEAMARMEMDRKTLRKKLKKVVDKLEGMRYNKEVRESEQALKKALNIENFIV